MKLSDTEIYYKNLKLLKPEDIKGYLVKNGWKLYHTYPDESGSIWTKVDFHVRLIHDADRYEDYCDMTQKLVETIANAEGIDKWNIIYQINSTKAIKTRKEIESKIMDLLNEIEGPLLYDDSIISVKKRASLDALRWVLTERDDV